MPYVHPELRTPLPFPAPGLSALCLTPVSDTQRRAGLREVFRGSGLRIPAIYYYEEGFTADQSAEGYQRTRCVQFTSEQLDMLWGGLRHADAGQRRAFGKALRAHLTHPEYGPLVHLERCVAVADCFRLADHLPSDFAESVVRSARMGAAVFAELADGEGQARLRHTICQVGALLRRIVAAEPLVLQQRRLRKLIKICDEQTKDSRASA